MKTTLATSAIPPLIWLRKASRGDAESLGGNLISTIQIVSSARNRPVGPVGTWMVKFSQRVKNERNLLVMEMQSEQNAATTMQDFPIHLRPFPRRENFHLYSLMFSVSQNSF